VILVTGGAGFIGSHVVDDLLARGHRVRVLDSLDPSTHPSRPGYLSDNAELIVGDLRDEATVARAVRGVEHVCHQAGRVGLEPRFGDVAAYVDHNALGTAMLLQALHAAGFDGRLVLASSMVVYGEGRYACAEHGVVRPGRRRPEELRAGRFEPPCPDCGAGLEPRAVPEEARLDPRNIYAATKVHQEHLATAFAHATGASVTALRYHNVFGPRMPRDSAYAGVASFFISCLRAGVAPRVFEDGGQLRDFVHVRDVARANTQALRSAQPIPGAFNVCSGIPRSVGGLAQALATAAGQNSPAPIVTGEFRAGDVRHVFASAQRAETLLGFRARENFTEAIREFADAPLRDRVGAA